MIESAPKAPPHLYDINRAEQAKEKSIAQVSVATPPEWRSEVLRALYMICRERAEFTTDDVWWQLDQWRVQAPPESRAMGGVMRLGLLRGWCKPSGKYQKSIRVECHRRPVAIWKSVRPLPAWQK